MGDTYRAVMLTKKGGPEVLETVEQPLPQPGPGEVRVRVRATGVGGTDITMRRGYYPYAPPKPFVPGYETIGDVDALGAGVTGLKLGDRVAALLVYGGYATHVVRGAEHWVKVPDGLDDAEAVSLILNYGTAYQMIHRSAAMREGQIALVNAAAGGVGQAMLDLLRAGKIRAIGAASASKHAVVAAYGATPIEGRTAPLDRGTLAVVPEGVDASFDGVGGVQTGECVRATRRGGAVVWYGFTGVANSQLGLLRGAMALFVGGKLSGRKPMFYGITQIYRKDPKPLHEDLATLFQLLKDKRIQPRITLKLPLLAAREANERLEKGGVDGKIVLVA